MNAWRAKDEPIIIPTKGRPKRIKGWRRIWANMGWDLGELSGRAANGGIIASVVARKCVMKDEWRKELRC